MQEMPTGVWFEFWLGLLQYQDLVRRKRNISLDFGEKLGPLHPTDFSFLYHLH